jgi:TRAP-type C4-dicarboxylate transport system substrate-binding protein
MGDYYLGWFDSGVCYNIWTVDPPAFTAAGDLDMSGTRLRGNAVCNAVFTRTLGAQVIDTPTGEVYAGLERGVVNATGWAQIGLIDLRWNDFVKYRSGPCFFSTDLGVIVNLESWNALTPEAQAILQAVAIEHEIASAEAHKTRRDDEFARLAAARMTEVNPEGEAAARHLRGARESTWARMRGLMCEHPSGDGNFDRLIELFYDLERAGG